MRDFGGLEAEPARVVRPASVAEVVAAVREADGLPVVARGCGHTTYGQSLTSDGVSVEMRGLRDIEVRPAENRVTVQAGATWREVLDATLPHGLTPPVLTDYLDLTVGGTLSAGGIGGTSFRHGAQTDHVSEIEVVTGQGDLVTCSAERNQDLFDAVRGGLGSCGIIVSATLDIVAAPARVRSFKFGFPSATELIAAQRALRGTADDIAGQAKPAVKGWTFEMTASIHDHSGRHLDDPLPGLPEPISVEDRSFADFADRMRPDVEMLITFGEWDRPHPWAILILPGRYAAELITEALSETPPNDLGTSGVVLINPLAPTATPLFPLPAEPFHFALLRTTSLDAPPPADSVAANHRLYKRVRAFGGTRYPVDSVPFSEADWRDHYGPAWAAREAARRRYGTRHARSA